MFAYIAKRILLMLPTLLGVLVLLFILFFWIASPQKIAQRVLGEKATAGAVKEWVAKKGYDKGAHPLRALVAFSGSLSDPDAPAVTYTEAMMNGFGEGELTMW